jgi:Zn-dependent protease with chaperone function
MKHVSAFVLGFAFVVGSLEAGDAMQFGQIVKRAQQFRDLQMTEQEEKQLGEAVSQRIRERYGVVQDQAVHKYVTLVGTVLTAAGSRPNLGYQFIVLDTDGVNAFAAPGGFIHITRGALALLGDESELAGVLAHEVIHVTEKHTLKAIQKGKTVQMGAEDTLSGNKELFNQVVEKATEVVMAGFGRAEELESDDKGLTLANGVGYAPMGLSAFLTRLSERNKAATEKQGLFASHPEMKERLDKIATQISSQKLASTATLADRYRSFITYQPRPQTEIAQVAAGSAGLTGAPAKSTEKDSGSTAKKEEPKKGGFGIGNLLKPGGGEKKSAEVTGSGASRGVDTERNAQGGSNPAIVVVNVAASDLVVFKKEGNLK